MFRHFRRKRHRVHEIAPDEIFLDSTNLPEYDPVQFEGRVVRPVSLQAILTVGIAFALVACGFGYRAFSLQVAQGDEYAEISRDNTLDRTVIFATRGLIYDRTGKELAWNEAPITSSTDAIDTAQTALTDQATSSRQTSAYALRKYTTLPGISHVLGFVQYP